MRKFITKIVLFISTGFLTTLICYITIPIKSIVYRPWEALIVNHLPIDAPFYPNADLNMVSVGDLCHHSENAIVKREHWKTDELGFRNDNYIRNADILIIGDSFTAGSSLNQSITISNRLRAIDRSLKVYNMAPSSMSQFDKLLKTGKINKPKLIIFSIVERYLPEKIQYFNPNSKKELLRRFISNSALTSEVDCFLKFLPFNWVKARINGNSGTGIPGKEDSKMFFLRGNTTFHSEEDAFIAADIIKGYKKYCDSLNIKFLFMPMPDKESVYYELVPLKKQPKYLLQLDSILSNSDISTINTLAIYNEYRKTNHTLLYHLDDTHWNANATAIIASEIISKVGKDNSI